MPQAARSPASTPKPSPATPSRQLHARTGPEQPRREGKEGTQLLYGRIVPRSPLPDKGGPKDSSPLQRSARRVLIVDTLNGLSRHVSPSSRANQLQAEEVSSTSNESSVPSTVSAAKVGPKHHDMSTSPPVRLASGLDDRSNVSPLPGAGLPDSVEDGALSDLELDVGAFVGGGSSSSSDSEDEPLLSLQEILDRSARPPDTPDKSAFPEPQTPGHRPPLPGKSRPAIYKNTLEQMLKEKEENQRLKDIELKVLVSCKEDLLKLADEEDCDVIAEGDISQEHRAILKRFSVVSNGIPDVHPGEEVFALSNFGRLFNQHSLDLRKCTVTPQNAAQKTLLQASPDELLFLIGTGLLLKAYRSSPCQPAVTRWLFQMMSVHLTEKLPLRFFAQ
ncbi:hypothetical protein AGOR_G00114040 [Albula goreensis]|uniref:Coiled-coil SMC6 And NSE5 INteracting (CANIN) domain-containing protein n=1 Tax=Albula goreensis TaxID=1534307 RepID=A0A8T3DDE8_9TELE|nr:hypothetical protein AGOR_G00114040 [Albula goreensis]